MDYSVPMSDVTVLTDDLYKAFTDGTISLADYLVLEPHNKLQRHWKVQSTDERALPRMKDAISRFGAVSIWDWEKFAIESEVQGYKTLFMEDPQADFDWKASLNQDPGVAVNSKLDGRIDRNGDPLKLINGFLPFQAVGLNFMRTTERFTYVNWSTGTGKTLFAEGTILIKKEEGYGPTKAEGFDVCLFVVKPGNLFNTQAKLTQHTGLESTILKGTPTKRAKTFAATAEAMKNGEQPILVFNAEKFREDLDCFKLLVKDKNVLVIFDEMPEKYANRGTALYRSTCEVFYTTFNVPSQGKNKGKKVYYPKVGADTTAGVFFVGMCATPIRNSPEDFFNCARLCDSTIYGPINDFNNLFVNDRDRWGQVTKWQNLDLMGAMAAHVVHSADKRTDPAIKAQFPDVLPPEIDFCDMDSATEKLYGMLQHEYEILGDNIGSLLDMDEILAAIGCFQMLCNNPVSVLDSALRREKFEIAYEDFEIKVTSREEALKAKGIKMFLAPTMIDWFVKKYKAGSEVALKLVALVDNDAKFTDEDSKGECIVSKMIKLRERIEEHDDKVIVFSAMNEMTLPYIAKWFDKWGITYVQYHGNLSAKQKQEAQDAFRTDPNIKVFLGTDAGKDSIDLPEASLTIHYDDPWTAAGKTQRENRQHRIDSEQDSVQVVTLTVPNTVEDRKAEIIQTKQSYQDQIFEGAIADQAEELTKKDFLYILTGDKN